MRADRAVIGLVLAACSGSGVVAADAPATTADAPVAPPDGAADAVPGLADAPPADAPPSPDAPWSICGPCARGIFFADCGGDRAAPPALGCDATGDCAWFVGGCAPAAYRLSACPASDICCDDHWPYASLQDPPAYSLDADFYGYGTTPWDDRRAMTVAVTFDGSVVEGTHTYTCTGTDPYPVAAGSACSPGARAAVHEAHVRGGILSFALGQPQVLGWYPTVEVDLRLATPTARVCVFRYTDVPRGSCTSGTGALCADAGTLVLSARPADDAGAAALAGRLDATIGALHLTASF